MSALALQILVVITFARTPPAEARDRNEQAAAAIETANAARAAGDIAAALEHYQRALELRPAAALHYNIAVCHHMLMSRAADSDPARERSRVAAIESYNRYLEERPEASDRVAVEKAILTLGGKPTSKPPFTVRRIRSNGSNGPRSTSAPTEEPSSAVEREAIGSQQARHSTGDNDDRSASAPTGALIERPPPAKEPPSPYSRGLFSVEAEVATLHPAPLGGSRLAAAPMLGPAITVGGLLGERKRVLLGAETAFSVQPAASSSKLTVSLWRLGFLSMVRFPLGSKRATIIAVGGQFGVGLESLHSSADPPLVQCGLDRDGLQSLRATALFVPRFTTTFLLGSTKRHGLNLRLDAGVAVMGEGRADRTSAQCTGPMAAERPFAEVGLTRAAALFAAFGLGYTLLF